MVFPSRVNQVLKCIHQKVLRGARSFQCEPRERTMVRRSVLDRIFQELQSLRYHLDDLESMFSNWHPQPLVVPESKLLSLPDHLRKTYLVVTSRGECSATQVSNLTGRSRAIESSYLNQLARMGWLTKRRDSKTLNFRPFPEQMLRKQLRQATSENGQRARAKIISPRDVLR
jgi:hypothetical protein